jgi:ubiquinone/menaquinone biosynthesis C-methylase UbiE
MALAVPETGSSSEEKTDTHIGLEYGNAAYWDERYSFLAKPFEWYQTWGRLFPVISPFFTTTDLALNIGCGNSPMAADIGSVFRMVANIDISSVVVEQMKTTYQDHENLLWFTMDCTEMTFTDEKFDVAFDKGTIDALLCGQDGIQKVEETLKEVHRVLNRYGIFVEITHGDPDARVPMFERFAIDWTLHDPIPIKNRARGGWHWIYVFEKSVVPWTGDSAVKANDHEPPGSDETAET